MPIVIAVKMDYRTPQPNYASHPISCLIVLPEPPRDLWPGGHMSQPNPEVSGHGQRQRIALGQPSRHRRFRIRRIHRARSRGARPAVRAARLHGDRQAPRQERAALSPGRNQLRRQRGAAKLCAGVRPRARPVYLRDRLPRQGCGVCVQAGDRARCLGRRGAPRADGAQHPGDQGHRRFAHLSRRPLSQGRRWRVDLRHRFRAARGRRATPAGRGFDLHRSPHAQRASRPDGRVGRLL